MASYSYSAIDASGTESRGFLHAPDLDSARDQLRQKGLLARTLLEQKAASGSTITRRAKKVTPKALQVFSRQFATLIQAGVSIVSALLILEEQTEDKNLAAVIADIREDVESGVVLSRAMNRHPKVFNRLYVAMIEAGEASGTLDVVLDRVAVQIEKDTKIKRRVKSAMIYPIVVLTFATLVLVGMLLFLIPVFVNIFKTLNGQLPMLTQIVLDMSNFLRGYWFIVFPLVGIAIFSLLKYKQTEQGRAIWDRVKLKLPMKIGDVVLKVAMARFTRTLSTLVSAGVDIVKALEITGSTAGNVVLEDALVEVRRRVHEGARIAMPLEELAIFPPMVSQMVKIGEETGELDRMLGKIADFYEDEVDSAVAALTSIIEPIMMIGVGVMVGIIVISMYLPMFKMLTLVK
jgi:type IV pilus assembly protein PilC